MFEDLVEKFRELFNPQQPHYLVNIGIIILLVVFAAYVFKRIGIPEALGFIIMGVLIGPSVIGIIKPEMITGESKIVFKIITGVALGFIGFHIGNEIKFSHLKKNFRSYSAILLGQAIIPFIFIIAGIVGWIYGFYENRNFYLIFLLAAVALPTAPAITASIIKESECSGPCTSTMIFVVGLDDIVGIIAVEFSLGLALLFYLPSSGTGAIAEAILSPLINIIGSVLIGLLLGFLFAFVLNRVKKTTLTIEFFFGTLLAIVGITEVLGWSELLACMTFGFILGNIQTERNEKAVRYGEHIFSPFVMLFFVFAGASLNIQAMFTNWLVIVVAITMVIFRLGGKWLGAYLGALITKSPKNIRNYVGPGLFAQGEMTIGLSMMIFNLFVDISASAPSGSISSLAAVDGAFLLNTIGLSIVIFQIISPFTTKWALKKAGELPVPLEQKPPLKIRIRTGFKAVIADIKNVYAILTSPPSERRIRNSFKNLMPSEVGRVASTEAAKSLVSITTTAAIEAAVPAAVEAAAEAAMGAIIEAVSERAIANPLEAPLEEINQAVRDSVSREVEDTISKAVGSALMNPFVLEDVGSVVENIMVDAIESSKDIEDLDVTELMDKDDLKKVEACETPLKADEKTSLSDDKNEEPKESSND